MPILKNKLYLALFFTRGVSLKVWDHIGMLDREVALYNMMKKMGVKITFVTYGNKTDLEYTKRLPGIRILTNRWGLPSRLYERWLPLLHGWHLRKADIFKTNQTRGADIALRAANLWRKPLVTRCGYMWSDFAGKQYGQNSPLYRQALSIEKKVFSESKWIIITTSSMKINIENKIHNALGRTVIIPNYVMTDIFSPKNNSDKKFDIVYVGRVDKQKNVEGLLEAIVDLDTTLLLIGNGELKSKLMDRFGNIHGRLYWIDRVANIELPRYINQAKIFILPSFYEGHPKTLIEAMACGSAVIGADSPGIREIIKHGETGWLCSTDPGSIRKAILHLEANPALCKQMGENARKYAKKLFSLDRIVKMELDVYKQVLEY